MLTCTLLTQIYLYSYTTYTMLDTYTHVLIHIVMLACTLFDTYIHVLIHIVMLACTLFDTYIHVLIHMLVMLTCTLLTHFNIHSVRYTGQVLRCVPRIYVTCDTNIHSPLHWSSTPLRSSHLCHKWARPQLECHY